LLATITMKKQLKKKIASDVLVKGDTYFRSGDLLRYDSDYFTYFEDRLGDTFRWKSENVSTEEVSTCLGRYPGIDEANVYGVLLPHHDGRAGCARILLSERTPLDLTGLPEFLSQNLPKYAVPVFIIVSREVVTTGNLKQLKTTARDAGVDPAKVQGVLWLKNGAYTKFTESDWNQIVKGDLTL